MTAQPSPDLPDNLQRQRDDWRARCEQAWTQLDQAQADLAAMTARAHTAENQLAEIERWCRIADHGQALKSGIPGSIGALGTGDIRKAIREAAQQHDETGPQTAPSSPRSAQQATVEGSDAGSPEGGSGGAAYLVGCPAEVWDGPYVYRCGMGVDVCARHGRFEPALRCAVTPGCRWANGHLRPCYVGSAE